MVTRIVLLSTKEESESLVVRSDIYRSAVPKPWDRYQETVTDAELR